MQRPGFQMLWHPWPSAEAGMRALAASAAGTPYKYGHRALSEGSREVGIIQGARLEALADHDGEQALVIDVDVTPTTAAGRMHLEQLAQGAIPRDSIEYTYPADQPMWCSRCGSGVVIASEACQHYPGQIVDGAMVHAETDAPVFAGSVVTYAPRSAGTGIRSAALASTTAHARCSVDTDTEDTPLRRLAAAAQEALTMPTPNEAEPQTRPVEPPEAAQAPATETDAPAQASADDWRAEAAAQAARADRMERDLAALREQHERAQAKARADRQRGEAIAMASAGKLEDVRGYIAACDTDPASIRTPEDVERLIKTALACASKSVPITKRMSNGDEPETAEASGPLTSQDVIALADLRVKAGQASDRATALAQLSREGIRPGKEVAP